MKLKIIPNEDNEVKGRKLVGCHFRYFLDDLEITDSLTALRLSMGPQELNAADLSFALDDVEVDVEVITRLEAHLEMVEQARRDEEALLEAQRDEKPYG